MRELAQELYRQGYNCCEAIVAAANQKYNLNMDNKTIAMSSCANNGLGIGTLCGTIIAGAMVIGYMMTEKDCCAKYTVNQARMKYVDRISAQLKSVNCHTIIKSNLARGSCERVVGIAAQILDEVIAEFCL